MAYITKSKADTILRCTSSKMETVGEVYHKKLYMFSKKELTHLLRYKSLMENPDGYFASYKAVKPRKDTFTFIKEGGTPSYHKSRNCEVLANTFTNYIIPEVIQNEGKEKCREFRKWFKLNEELLEEDSDKFYALLKEKYGVTKLDKIVRENSGVVQFIDMTVEELEEEIDKLILDTNKYLHRPKVVAILKSYSKYYYQAKEGYVIPEITTDHTNKEILKVLLEYKNKYKQPLADLLKTYFRAKYNPNLNYDVNILEQLGFKPCPFCCR